MIRDLKQGTSKLIAETRLFFSNCSCNVPTPYIRYKHINKNDMWEYSIRCDYCGKIIYDTEKKK